MKQVKTIEARLKEVIEFRKKFEELGLDSENEQMKELIEKMNRFVKDGAGFSDKIQLSDYGRVAICKFSTRPRCVSTIVLRALTKLE
jgi:hypothetical protein